MSVVAPRRAGVDRRGFVGAIGLGIVGVPRLSGAQAPGKLWRVAYLGHLGPSNPQFAPLFHAFQDGLREHGYVEGQNLVLDLRFSDGDERRFPELAAELARLKPDVIVAAATNAVRAAIEVTAAVPIVMVNVGDPVAYGIVSSLARPGGRVTGLATLVLDLFAKRLQLIKEVVPSARRVIVQVNPDVPGVAEVRRELDRVASPLGVTVQYQDIRDLKDLDAALAAMVRDRVDGLVVGAPVLFFREHARIAEFAARRRIPAVYAWTAAAEAGGLMSYAPHQPEQFRRAAAFVDRLLKGTPPGELPIEQPTRFELVVNMRTARAIGLTIPPSVLVRADRVIEP